MAKRIIIKTVHGRKYRYERVDTKRKGGKVVTTDKYLGPVGGKKGSKIEQASSRVRKNIEGLFQAGYPVVGLVERVWETAGIEVSESTIRNYMKRKGVGRMSHWSEPRSESAKEGWAKKRHETALKRRRTAYHAKILLEEGEITAKQLIGMSEALDEKRIATLWGAREEKRKSKKRRKM